MQEEIQHEFLMVGGSFFRTYVKSSLLSEKRFCPALAFSVVCIIEKKEVSEIFRMHELLPYLSRGACQEPRKDLAFPSVVS